MSHDDAIGAYSPAQLFTPISLLCEIQKGYAMLLFFATVPSDRLALSAATAMPLPWGGWGVFLAMRPCLNVRLDPHGIFVAIFACRRFSGPP